VRRRIPLSYQHVVLAFREAFTSLDKCQGYHFLRFYLAGVLRDICGWQVPLASGTGNPHLISRYLEVVAAPKPHGVSK